MKTCPKSGSVYPYSLGGTRYEYYLIRGGRIWLIGPAIRLQVSPAYLQEIESRPRYTGVRYPETENENA